jgi:hypothetical protein
MRSKFIFSKPISEAQKNTAGGAPAVRRQDIARGDLRTFVVVFGWASDLALSN